MVHPLAREKQPEVKHEINTGSQPSGSGTNGSNNTGNRTNIDSNTKKIPGKFPELLTVLGVWKIMNNHCMLTLRYPLLPNALGESLSTMPKRIYLTKPEESFDSHSDSLKTETR